MDDDRVRLLELAAGQLAALVGMLHLGLGVRYWALYAGSGFYFPPDIRVPLWTFSGVAVLIGVVAATRGAPRIPVYGLGIIMMLVYILGYFSWHLGGHRAFFFVGDPQLHDTGVVTFLVDHIFAGPIEFFALATETIALVLLAVLVYETRGG